ncbi:MAG TPA: hypothetical protein VNH18_10630 [Bryobacteraceae bacterium]|nr:hypothetical protein [Bryobacteraceae bacterium]
MTSRGIRSIPALMAIASMSVWAEDRTVRISNPPNEQGFQQLATVVRTVGQIRNVAVDPSKATFTFEGDPGELATCEWLLRSMDKPRGWTPSVQDVSNPASREFRPASGGDDLIRIWYLRSAGSPRDVQEILTILRTVADVRMVMNFGPELGLALRGNAATMDMADWLLSKIDVSAGEGPGEVYIGKGAPEDMAQVLYLNPARTPQELQNLIGTVRTTGHVNKVFSRTSPPMIAVRGTPAVLATTRQTVASLGN